MRPSFILGQRPARRALPEDTFLQHHKWSACEGRAAMLGAGWYLSLLARFGHLAPHADRFPEEYELVVSHSRGGQVGQTVGGNIRKSKALCSDYHWGAERSIGWRIC